MHRFSTEHRCLARFSSSAWVAAILALLPWLPTIVQAQEGPNQARIALTRGLEARAAGDDVVALSEFQRAFDLAGTSEALGQIALAEQALGRFVSAEGHLQQALEDAEDPWVERHRGTLEGALEALRDRLGSVDVHANVPGAELYVSGEPAGRLPLSSPRRVVAGEVVVELRAEGYLPIRRVVRVAPRQLSRETFRLVPRQAAEAAVSLESSPELVEEESFVGSGAFWAVVVASTMVVIGAAVAVGVAASGDDEPTFAASDVGGVIFALEEMR